MGGSLVTASEAGRKLNRFMNRLSAEERDAFFITDSHGHAKAVLLDIDKYHAMMDALEDEGGGPDAAVAGALLKAILRRAREG
jgi:PHD/YefM family antitoxin component YafN of YafNO toxin-antitoxin module